MTDPSQETRDAPPTERGTLRVVVLGDEGLDAGIRNDAAIETVRSGSMLEAIGELAAPPASATGRRTVVVIGPGAATGQDEAPFVTAIRQADASARVVRVGRNGGARHPGVDYDAVLDRPATGESLRALLGPAAALSVSHEDPTPRAGSVQEIKATAPQPPRGEAPAETTDDEPPVVHVTDVAAAPPAPTRSGEGDASLLSALDAPREAFERRPCVCSPRGWVIPRSRWIAACPPPDARGHAGVTVGGRTEGRLVSERLDAGELAPHAAWLASWLAHHDTHRSLRRAAFTDPLTDAWNRRYFDGFLRAALDRARGERRTVTVLVFDIDGFKQYNDNYGHPAGDEILIETVRALKSVVRPSDRVCRIGGDEFAVIFDEPEGPRQSGSRPPESVFVLAKRVQQKIGEKEFPKLGADAKGTLTISGGLAAYPWDGHDAETLLERADQLACQSKRQGKNAITVGPGAERVCRGEDDAG